MLFKNILFYFFYFTVFLSIIIIFYINSNINQNVENEKKKIYIHKFTDAGLGHKFFELLVSYDYAKTNNMNYKLDCETFNKNYRNVDYSWFINIIQEDIQCYNNTDNIFYKLENENDMIETNISNIVYYHEGYEYCKTGINCFFNNISYFNNNHLSKFNKNVLDRISIHLRFGDISPNNNANFYVDLIKNITNIYNYKVFLVFCAQSTEKLLMEILDIYNETNIVNNCNTRETFNFLFNSKVQITSASSFSYIPAYMCKNCIIYYNKPKEYDNKFYDEHYDKTAYYKNGWIKI